MKSFVPLFAVAAGFASAQSLSDLPDCAAGCIQDALPDSGCGATDVGCLCSNFDDIREGAFSCLTSECSTSELAQALSAAQEICSGAVSSIGSDISSIIETATLLPTDATSETETATTTEGSDSETTEAPTTMPTLSPSSNGTTTAVETLTSGTEVTTDTTTIGGDDDESSTSSGADPTNTDDSGDDDSAAGHAKAGVAMAGLMAILAAL